MSEIKKNTIELMPGVCFMKKNKVMVVIIASNKNKQTVTLMHVIRKRTIEDTTMPAVEALIESGDFTPLEPQTSLDLIISHIQGGKSKIAGLEEKLKLEHDIVTTYRQLRSHIDGLIRAKQRQNP